MENFVLLLQTRNKQIVISNTISPNGRLLPHPFASLAFQPAHKTMAGTSLVF